MRLHKSFPSRFYVRRFFRRGWWRARRQWRRLTEGSLLVKILAVLVLGVGLVVSTHTYLIANLQERWDQDRFNTANMITTLMVQEQITRCMLAGPKRSHPLPRVLAKEPNGTEVWLVDDEQKVLFSTDAGDVGRTWSRAWRITSKS